MTCGAQWSDLLPQNLSCLLHCAFQSCGHGEPAVGATQEEAPRGERSNAGPRILVGGEGAVAVRGLTTVWEE
jgi:hypothetical protein